MSTPSAPPVVTKPTCTLDGFTTYTCVCGETKTDNAVPATGHNMVNGVCSVCGERETHTHDFVKKVVDPTCTEQGYTVYTCSCGESYTKNYVSALGHTTEIRNAKDATCAEEGYTGDEVCTLCGETIKQGESIPATDDHVYGSDKVCDICGHKQTTAESIRDWFNTTFEPIRNIFDKIFGRF